MAAFPYRLVIHLTVSIMETSITHIVHLADIHIGSSADRGVEYRCVFDKLFSAIANGRPQGVLVVIAGDIFHYKTKYSGEDVDDFHYLMRGLSAYPVIIIPGNHDDNVRNPSRTDLITPLTTDYPNVIYRKESGVFTVHGLKFYHVNIFDAERLTSDEIQQAIEAAQFPIMLFHGAINGTKYNNHTVSGSKITARTIALTRLLLAGDIHQHQFITPNAAYSGSLIQQNIAEDRAKGYIIWDLNTNSGQFVALENNHGFIRLDLRGQTVGQTMAALETIARSRPEHLRKVSIITDAPEEMARQQAEQVKAITGRLDRVKRVETHPAIINPLANVVEALTELVRKSGATEDQLAAIIELHTSKTVAYESRRWHVTRLAFDYMFKYGKGNVIDFTKLTGTSGVVAANCAGKTSIIDVLVFGLFGESLRGDLKSVKRNGSERMSVRVDFNVKGVDYYVDRAYSKSKAIVGLYKKENDAWVNISGGSIDNTNTMICNLIGTIRQFLATGLYYEAREDIFRLGAADRMKLLVELFGVIDNSSIIKDIKRTIAATNKKIAKLVVPRQGDHKTDLVAINAQLLEQQALRAQLAAELSEIDTSMNTIRARIVALRPIDQVSAELTMAEQSLARARRELAQIHVEQEVNHAEIVTIEPAKRIELQSKCDPSLPSCDQLSKEITHIKAVLPPASGMSAAQLAEGPALEKQLGALNEALAGFPAPPPMPTASDGTKLIEALVKRLDSLSLRPEVTWISTLQAQVDKLSAKLGQIQLGPGVSPCDDLGPLETRLSGLKTQKHEDTGRLRERIDELSCKIGNIQLKPRHPHDNIGELEGELGGLVLRVVGGEVDVLRAQVDKLRAALGLQFEATCRSCTHNKSILAEDLVRAEGRLVEAEQAAERARKENAVITERRQEVMRKINVARQIESDNTMAEHLEIEHGVLVAELKRAEFALERAISIQRENDEVDAERRALAAKIATVRRVMSENDTYRRLKREHDDLSADLMQTRGKLAETMQLDVETRQFNAAVASEIATLKSQITEMRRIADLNKDIELTKANIANITNKLAAIRQANASNTERSAMLKRLALLEKQLDRSRESEMASRLLGRLYLYEQYLLCKQRDALTADISALERRAMVLSAERDSIVACVPLVEQLGALGVKRHQLMEQREAAIELIGRLTDRQATTSKEIGVYDEYWATYPPLKADLDKYKLYVECLESPALMTSIISKNMPKIIDRCNDNLSTAASFRLTYNITETKVEFYIEDQETHVKSPAALASGFQKFIMMVSLRLAIAMTTPIACDFIMIDEGFGCMDDDNISKISDLFSLITGDYRFVFIISHKHELQNIITDPLYITSYDDATIGAKCSRVNNSLAHEPLPNAVAAGKRPIIGYPINVPVADLGPIEDTPRVAGGGVIGYPANTQPADLGDGIVFVDGKKKIKCECGLLISHDYMKQHVMRTKHKDRMRDLGRAHN